MTFFFNENETEIYFEKYGCKELSSSKSIMEFCENFGADSVNVSLETSPIIFNASLVELYILKVSSRFKASSELSSNRKF